MGYQVRDNQLKGWTRRGYRDSLCGAVAFAKTISLVYPGVVQVLRLRDKAVVWEKRFTEFAEGHKPD